MMKRFLFLMLVIISLFFSNMVVYASNSQNYEVETLEDKEKEELINEIIMTEGNIESSKVDDLKKTLSKVQIEILEDMEMYDWKICITSHDIASYYLNGEYGNKVRGITDFDTKMIYVEPRAVYSTPLHEIGHFIDWENFFPSENSEFEKIYYEENSEFKENIDNPGCFTSAQEMFEEIFCIANIDTSKCTPKALKYVESFNY